MAAYARYGSLGFRPDPLADLLFNGIAQRVDRSSLATGLQADGRYAVTSQHTLRAGALFATEQTSRQTSSLVLPAAAGVQTSDQPIRIFDSTGQLGYTGSVYLQDEWWIVPAVTLNVGLRLDAYAAFRSEWQWSPRVNVVWQPTATTTLHAGYARYFTPPRQEFVSIA
jgi:outer membrane receptor protein involved in Fe transport